MTKRCRSACCGIFKPAIMDGYPHIPFGMVPYEKTIEIALGVVVFAATSFLGLAVFVKNPKSWTHRLFLLIAAYIDIYAVSNFFSLHPPLGTAGDQLFWIRAVMFFSAFLGPLLVCFAATFPGITFRPGTRYAVPLLVLMLLSAALSFTPLVFKGIAYPNGQPVPVPGAGIGVYALDFIGLIALSLAIMVWKYRHATGLEKARQSALLVGMLVSFSTLAVLTFVFVVFLKTSAAVFLGPAYLLVLLAAIAYAIVRHHFLDIQPIVARGVSFAIFLAILAGVYSAVLLLVVDRFVPIDANLLGVFLALLAVTAVSFQSLERAVRRVTNKVFFAARYDPDVLLAALTHIMAGTIDLGEMATGLLRDLLEGMNVTKGAFLIVEKHVFTDVFAIGYADRALLVPELETLFHGASPSRNHYVFEDMEEGPRKALFRRLDISIAIPVRVKAAEVALLVLGGKRSGQIFYENDVAFLDLFASEAGLAIQNARAYAEIKRFSKELERRVEERTEELKRTQARELAEARNVARLKDEFVFVAHELRTPIAAIKGFLELVSAAPEALPNDVKENLRAISSASETLNQLIGDLLEIARSESGTIQISVSPTDLVPVIRSVVEDVRPLAAERKISMSFSPEPGLPRALVDPGKAKEVVMNLVSNGIKYNKPGGALAISLARKGGTLAMTFADTGYGIPKDQQGQIFQKFFRARDERTKGVTGTGLGLFIVRMLVDKMGGTVSFVSEEEKGSVFTASFPAADRPKTSSV